MPLPPVSCSSTGCTRRATSRQPSTTCFAGRWVARSPGRPSARRVEERRKYIESVYEYVAEHGPLVAGDIAERDGKKGAWWDYDDGKLALAALFYEGRLTATRRRSDFARVYDLPERVLPPEVLAVPAVPEHEARKELLVAGCQVPRDRHCRRPRRLPPAGADEVQVPARRARRRGSPHRRRRARVESPRLYAS